MSLRKLQVLCKQAVIEEVKNAYLTDNSEENFMMLIDAYIKAERIEDVKKGMSFIGVVLEVECQRDDLLYYLACGHVRCAEYTEALESVEKCLAIDENFWKVKALKEIITVSSSQNSQMSLKSRLGYGALTAVAAAAGGIALLWSSPKMKLLRTRTFPEWKDASDLVDKIENKMRENTPMGTVVGGVSVGIVVVGYLIVLAKHVSSG